MFYDNACIESNELGKLVLKMAVKCWWLNTFVVQGGSEGVELRLEGDETDPTKSGEWKQNKKLEPPVCQLPACSDKPWCLPAILDYPGETERHC